MKSVSQSPQVVAKSTEYKKQIVLKEGKTSFEFSVPEKPRKVILNKYGEGLAHDIITAKLSSSSRASSR